MLTGISSREQIEAAHQATSLPLCVLNPPADARNDRAFLDANMRILMLGNPTYAIAVKAIHDSLSHLRDGGALEDLVEHQASPAPAAPGQPDGRVHRVAAAVFAGITNED